MLEALFSPDSGKEKSNPKDTEKEKPTAASGSKPVPAPLKPTSPPIAQVKHSIGPDGLPVLISAAPSKPEPKPEPKSATEPKAEPKASTEPKQATKPAAEPKQAEQQQKPQPEPKQQATTKAESTKLGAEQSKPQATTKPKPAAKNTKLEPKKDSFSTWSTPGSTSLFGGIVKSKEPQGENAGWGGTIRLPDAQVLYCTPPIHVAHISHRFSPHRLTLRIHQQCVG